MSTEIKMPQMGESIAEGTLISVLIVHEDNLTGGVGGELAALIGEHVFEWLDAPVRRLGALDIPIPYAGSLEEASLPGVVDIMERVRQLAEY